MAKTNPMDSPGASPGAFSFLSRRRFLAWGLAGGSALLMGGVGGLAALRGCAPEVEGLRVLNNQEYRTLSALAQTHLPRGGPFAWGAEDLDMARLFDQFLLGEPKGNVRELKWALFFVEFGPVLFERRLVTFSHLDESERLKHWQSWIRSPRLLQRKVAIAFRKFLSLVFFDQEKVWKHIGYPGPALQRSAP